MKTVSSRVDYLENILVYLNVSGVATVLNFHVYSYQICETLDARF